MNSITRLATMLVAALTLTLGACGKKEAPPPVAAAPAPVPMAAPAPAAVAEPVAVKQVVLASQIDAATKQAVAPATSFAAKDTIYAVVDTVGSGQATIKARWTFHKGDKSVPVSETVQEITATGPATNEFHISKPDGWPVGDYQVEVLLGDTSVGSHKFTVK